MLDYRDFQTQGLVFLAISITITPMNAMLAIETSVPHATVALWCDGQKIFEEEFTTDRNHNSMVFDPLKRALKMLDGQKLSLVLAGTGPGSYSGTRVGIAVAQGIAIAHHCPAVGIGSLAATPVARDQEVSTPSMAIGDARRGLYFISKISPSGEAMDAVLLDAETFQQQLTEASDTRLFTLDDPAKLGLSETLAKRVTRSRPEAKWLLDIWQGLGATRRDELRLSPLAPAYLRPPFTSKAKGGHPLLRSKN